MSFSPLLSVIIVTYNAGAFLHNCLTSVFSQQTGFPFEVIIVDNASTDGSLKRVSATFPQARIVRNGTNRGFASANNQGIEIATGDILLLLNPDTVLQGEVFQPMVDYFAVDPVAGVVGPKILNADGSLQRTGVAFPRIWNVFCELFFLDILFPSTRIFGRHRRLYENPETIVEAEYLQGSCLFIRRSAISESGNLDERFHLYFEETDLCFRIKQKGWSVKYVPSGSVIHFGGGGMTYYDARRLVQFHRSYLRYLTKHHEIAMRFAFRCVLFLRAVVRALFFGLGMVVIPSRRREFASRSWGYVRSAFLIAGVIQ